jgi:hypothetical protein
VKAGLLAVEVLPSSFLIRSLTITVTLEASTLLGVVRRI